MIELSYPGDLTDADELAVQLSTTGLSPEACRSKARLFAKAVAALSVTGNAGHGPPSLAFFVPGRIEVLGKHTDYAGGRSDGRGHRARLLRWSPCPAPTGK